MVNDAGGKFFPPEPTPASEPTVRRDVKARDANASREPTPANVNTETVEVRDEPAKVTGMDGKQYSRPEPQKPRRRPLADQAQDAETGEILDILNRSVDLTEAAEIEKSSNWTIARLIASSVEQAKRGPKSFVPQGTKLGTTEAASVMGRSKNTIKAYLNTWNAAADGKRDNGRWRYGSASEKFQIGKSRLAEAGLILDFKPDLAEVEDGAASSNVGLETRILMIIKILSDLPVPPSTVFTATVCVEDERGGHCPLFLGKEKADAGLRQSGRWNYGEVVENLSGINSDSFRWVNGRWRRSAISGEFATNSAGDGTP